MTKRIEWIRVSGVAELPSFVSRTDRLKDIDERLPRYIALRDDLAKKIAEDGWNTDKPIPSEAKLASHYGVALGTMRRAIEELVREGVLERRHGSGTYVRRSDFSGSLSRFLRFRSSHSTIAFQESKVLLAETRPAPDYVAEALKIDPGKDAIYLDRRRYQDGDLLVTEDIWLPLDRFGALLEMPLGEIGPLLYRTYEERCGQVIARAQESLKIVPADPAIAGILEKPPETMVIMIERTSFGFADDVLEWRRSHAAADHFEYRIEIR